MMRKKSKRKIKARVRRKERAQKKLKAMSRSELVKYKELLLREREKAGGGISHVAETSLKKSQRESSGDLSGYSYHMADMASDDYERDFSLGRASEEQKILYAIDEALKRINDGTYGNCLQCGKKISKKRLEALPFTELCILCQKSKEE
jgi:RNA polymerase-binding protein DksA